MRIVNSTGDIARTMSAKIIPVVLSPVFGDVTVWVEYLTC
jgi:hypothetical protein